MYHERARGIRCPSGLLTITKYAVGSLIRITPNALFRYGQGSLGGEEISEYTNPGVVWLQISVPGPSHIQRPSPFAATLSLLSKVRIVISGKSFWMVFAVPRCQRSAPRKGHFWASSSMISHAGKALRRRHGPRARTSRAASIRISAKAPSLLILEATACVST